MRPFAIFPSFRGHRHWGVHVVEMRVLDARDPAIASQIVAVQRAAYAVEAALIGFDGIPPLHETEDDVARLDLVVLGVIENEQVVAMAGYRRSGNVVDVDRLVVRPDRFRRGLGSRLLREIHKRETTATRFTVSTSRDNEPALRLYGRAGYSAVEDAVVAGGLVVRRLDRRTGGKQSWPD